MSAETPKSIPWTDRGALAGSIKAPAAPQPRSSRDVEILRSLAKRINPHDAGAHNNLGVVYYNKGLYQEAIVHFEKALELDPRMHVAERNLQIAYFHTGFYETMVAELQERLRHNPHDSEAHDRLARAHFYGGDVPSAIAEWRKAIEARPGSFDLHMRLARAEQQRGSLDMALLELNAALKLEPRSARAHLLRGEVLYQTGETAGARQALETAIALDNAIAEAHHLLAFVYGELGEQQRAESSAARAAELNPSYGKAQTNLSLDSYNSARYAELVGERTRPETAEEGTLAHYNMGLEFRQKALYDDALREFRLATERGEDKLLVGSAEAEMLLLRGDSEAAAKLYEDLVKEEPNSPKLWNELGVARHQAGNLDEAERAYRHALDLDPDYALAWNNLAVARHHRGDAHESESAFRAALAHGRAIADVWRNLGLMLMRSGRLEHALDAYKRALEADPESALAYAGLGIALMDSARPAEAKAALVRAVEIDPNLPEARYHLAFALSALGDYQGALRETKLALDLNPYIPQPRYKLLIDLQFEEASVLAPELDTPQRVMAPGGESIPQFEFKPESLDAAFDSALPETAAAAGAAAADVANAQDGAPLLEEARKSLALGKLEDATEQAQRALRAGADRREFLLLQGDIYARRGLAGEAVERFTGALAEVTAHSDPSSEVTEDIVRRALAGAARCFLELGKMGEAVEAAERLCAMSPNDGSALRLLGRSLARVSDYQRAVMVLEQARTIDGGGDASLLTELGSAYLGAGQRAAAERTLRKAVELDEFAVGARVTLGRLLASSHRNEEAARELRAALEFLPSHGEAAFALAELERRQGNLRAAIDVMIDLLTVDPYHLDALVGLGALLVENGREDQAQLAFERVLRFDPRHDVAARALAQLRTHEPVHAG
ncbi:MAG TPA: tetratricopeptide repeat protein [Longimicrobiales bacterium]